MLVMSTMKSQDEFTTYMLCWIAVFILIRYVLGAHLHVWCVPFVLPRFHRCLKAASGSYTKSYLARLNQNLKYCEKRYIKTQTKIIQQSSSKFAKSRKIIVWSRSFWADTWQLEGNMARFQVDIRPWSKFI
jgi:hypothetical protein